MAFSILFGVVLVVILLALLLINLPLTLLHWLQPPGWIAIALSSVTIAWIIGE